MKTKNQLLFMKVSLLGVAVSLIAIVGGLLFGFELASKISMLGMVTCLVAFFGTIAIGLLKGPDR